MRLILPSQKYALEIFAFACLEGHDETPGLQRRSASTEDARVTLVIRVVEHGDPDDAGRDLFEQFYSFRIRFGGKALCPGRFPPGRLRLGTNSVSTAPWAPKTYGLEWSLSRAALRRRPDWLSHR